MQINSISNIGFKGYSPSIADDTGAYYNSDFDVFDEGSYEPEVSDSDPNHLEYKYTGEDTDFFEQCEEAEDIDYSAVGSAVKRLKNVVKYARNNVHPFTVVISTVIGGLSALTTKKNAMPFVRKTAVTIGQYISSGAVKAFSAVAGLFHKKIDAQSINQNVIGKFADKLRSTGAPSAIIEQGGKKVEQYKMLDTIKDFVTKSTDEKTANKVVNQMKKFNIKTPAQVFDVLVASVIALFTGDVVSDRVEQRMDKVDIQNAMRNFEDETGLNSGDIIDGSGVILEESYVGV